MDVLELLKTDHDKVKRLCVQIVEDDNEKHRRALFRTIKSELDTHTFIEETVFYPAFRRYDELSGWLDQAVRDHRTVTQLLTQLESKFSIEDFKSLKEEVESHISEEENEFFPKVRKIMRRPEREALGRHVEAARQEKSEAA